MSNLPGLDQAFDQHIAAGVAPWLVARNGEGFLADTQPAPAVPAGAPPRPRLDSAWVPNAFADTGGDYWLPAFEVLPAGDTAFRFAVTQTGEVDDEGEPFNRATLTLSLGVVMPASLRQIAWEKPPRLVPDLQVIPTLVVPVTLEDGSTQTRSAIGTSTPTADPNIFQVRFALTGSIVEAAYVHLTRGEPTHPDGVTITIQVTHSAYQLALAVGDPPFLPWSFQLFGDGTGSAWVPLGQIGILSFFAVTTRRSRDQVALTTLFNTDEYRSRFTITADATTRPIIDAADLHSFAVPRSEYRELTSLGGVQAQYPSLRQVYFGQVSGTVVAIPAAYGIVCGPGGLAAVCDAVVDPASSSSTGCRFHFTFTVAPLADPIDLARLERDIHGLPEAVGRTLRLTLPPGLDKRHRSTLDGFPSGSATFADGTAAHTAQVGVDIVDDQTIPSTTLVNMFLAQLAAKGPAPLFGSVSVRLDDVLPQPISPQLVLNLRQSIGSGELIVGPPGEEVTLMNDCPFALLLHGYALRTADSVDVVALPDPTLLPAQSTTVTGRDDVSEVAVSRSVVVPAVVSKQDMLAFVAFNTQVVSEVQHPLTVNAAAVTFTDSGVTAVTVTFSLIELPQLPLPPLTLRAGHTVDSVHAQVPVTAAVTGLDCTVNIQISAATGARSHALKHDFADEPILVLTDLLLA